MIADAFRRNTTLQRHQFGFHNIPNAPPTPHRAGALFAMIYGFYSAGLIAGSHQRGFGLAECRRIRLRRF